MPLGTTLADAGGARGQGQAAPGSAGTADPVHYRVVDSLFSANRRLTGSGTGARLEYQDIDPSFLEMVRSRVVDQPLAIERDSTRRNYLHPLAGSEAAALGAGLFTKTAA